MTDNVIQFPKPEMSRELRTITYIIDEVLSPYRYDEAANILVSCVVTFIGIYKRYPDYTQNQMCALINTMLMIITKSTTEMGIYTEEANEQLIHKLKQSYTVDIIGG